MIARNAAELERRAAVMRGACSAQAAAEGCYRSALARVGAELVKLRQARAELARAVRRLERLLRWERRRRG